MGTPCFLDLGATGATVKNLIQQLENLVIYIVDQLLSCGCVRESSKHIVISQPSTKPGPKRNPKPPDFGPRLRISRALRVVRGRGVKGVLRRGVRKDRVSWSSRPTFGTVAAKPLDFGPPITKLLRGLCVEV